MCEFKGGNLNIFFFPWKATDNGGKGLVKQINEKSSCDSTLMCPTM